MVWCRECTFIPDEKSRVAEQQTLGLWTFKSEQPRPGNHVFFFFTWWFKPSIFFLGVFFKTYGDSKARNRCKNGTRGRPIPWGTGLMEWSNMIHFFGTKHGVCNIRVMELFHSIICKCVNPLDDDPHKTFSSSNVFFRLGNSRLVGEIVRLDFAVQSYPTPQRNGMSIG